jgi:Xaa-Pro aminopeptidase
MIKNDFLNIRQNKLKRLKDEFELNSILLSSPSAKKYLIDIEVENSLFIYGNVKLLLIYHKMFQETVFDDSCDFDRIVISQPLLSFLKGKSILSGRVGIEEDHLTVSFVKSLKRIFPKIKFVDISERISHLIGIHDEESISRFKKASSISQKVYHTILSEIAPNVTEFDIAQEIVYLIKKYGGESESFSPIVAFGKSSSQPHYVPQLKKMGKNKLVLIDFGVMYKGICSDISRTILLSENKEIFKSYLIVKEALTEVEKLIKSGLHVADLDNSVRKIFKEYNLEENFIHSLGHGIGYNVHQNPRISYQSNEVLEENQIIAIEPALYFSGKFGIRIENNYLVTKNGSLNLTNY